MNGFGVCTKGWCIPRARLTSARSLIKSLIRGLSANYFVALEQLLSDSLAFASWVLTADHVSERHPFSFDAAAQVDIGFSYLLEADDERERPSEGWTLRPLCDGFKRLADLLEAAGDDADDVHRRDPAAFPDFAGRTALQHFPFDHVMAFLDLTPTSRRRILELLQAASENLIKSRVFEVRNEQLHFRRASSDVDKLIGSLTHVESAVRLLEDAGFTRILFFQIAGSMTAGVAARSISVTAAAAKSPWADRVPTPG